ncbi:hypothetical protein EET67_00755 [Pseudaminobacter arsenicus]|uniref:YubB ferredoxin-like domain-containing protein n=1 Tax=Borborobacter arsenicus TaxID=1851146 RepID=A0A432VBJ9_9HYPH|nr:hypothetical protein [Pseudaminobacter arsenicus]RUM99473.1 hypothetical protein EET67_00755 [Pseudaminobacter arsenicus]
MPDFIDNHIFVTGPEKDLGTFRQSHFACNKRTGRVEFDLGSIVPMPDVLRDIEGDSESDLALLALGADLDQTADPWSLTFDRVREFDWVKAAGIRSRQELLAHLNERTPAAVSAARKRVAAFQQTGYHDGHVWRLANWGVKWSPTSTFIVAQTPELLEFGFETPWCFPEPAFRRLGLIYPTLCFDITAANPDLGIGIQGHVLGDEVRLERMSMADIYDGCAGTSRFDETHEEEAPP